MAVVLATLVASQAASEYMGNGVTAYFNRKGNVVAYTVPEGYGVFYVYNQYGYYIGYNVIRNGYLYSFMPDGRVIGRYRLR